MKKPSRRIDSLNIATACVAGMAVILLVELLHWLAA